MKRRIGGDMVTGLGGNAKTIIDGKPTENAELNKQINAASKEAVGMFFKKWEWCDAGIDRDEIRIGIEPTYQFEPLKMIVLKPDINECQFITGRAVGPWASTIISTSREYGDYQNRSKFVRFVQKWHPIFYSSGIFKKS